MVRRHARSRAFASAFVFPGGTVCDDDLAYPVPADARLADTLVSRSDTPVTAAEASALYVCAIRELFEEAGVFLARSAHGLLEVDASDTAVQERLASTRLALQAHELSIGQVLADNALEPAFDLLIPFSHWITPVQLAARFDTHFFVASLPPRQSALHDTIETSEGLWLSPARALGDEYHTVYATVQHLRRLEGLQSVNDLVEFARAKPIRTVLPEMVESAEGMRVTVRPEIADTW